MRACHSTKVFPKTKYTINKERGEKEEGGRGDGEEEEGRGMVDEDRRRRGGGEGGEGGEEEEDGWMEGEEGRMQQVGR